MRNIILLITITVFIFSCQKSETGNVVLSSPETVLIKTIATDSMLNMGLWVSRKTTTEYFYDHLKRMVHINESTADLGTIPFYLPNPYIAFTSVIYSGSSNVPLQSNASNRSITNGIPNSIYDSTQTHFFYDGLNRKIKDSVIKSSFNNASGVLQSISTIVKEYDYRTPNRIFVKVKKTSGGQTNFRNDTAWTDTFGNIINILAKENGINSQLAMRYDTKKNPSAKFRYIYELIPETIQVSVPYNSLGFNNCIGYGSTMTNDNYPNMIVCGTALFNFFYDDITGFPTILKHSFNNNTTVKYFYQDL